MRRLFSGLVAVCIVTLFTTTVFAKTSVLIDFDKLRANGDGQTPGRSWTQDQMKEKAAGVHYDSELRGADPRLRPQHMPTLLKYNSMAGSNISAAEAVFMVTSLAAGNWNVVLNSSARTVMNRQFSFTKEWHTRFVELLYDAPDVNELLRQYEGDSTKVNDHIQQDRQRREQNGYTILGVRVRFPETIFNNWALVTPPFEIPAYEDIASDFSGKDFDPVEDADTIVSHRGKGEKFLDGYGVVRNVGQLKSMAIRVYGCQFNNSISILLKDDNSVVTEYQMPRYLNYDGWAEIVWQNPNYITRAENRDLYVVPLYPRNIPYVKLDGFRIYRQGDQIGGDFVTYIKDVKITYDEAIYENPDPENVPVINHEEAWGILQDRNEAAKVREYSKISNQEILRFLERQRMHSGSN